ncbi:type IV pilus biogenesis/stability protein PilW [Candidatus Halobeggiatoa sp. HSG11]|nr:type IV pilus biogenesis/stability protein PilW [Candidatus Halobeggiatoa sp. HSG11]
MKQTYKIFVLWLTFVLISACTSINSKNTCSPKKEKTAATNVELGIEYMRRGKNDIALQRLKKAIDFCPSFAKGHNAIAVLYERVREVEKSEHHYQQALKYGPNNSDIHSNYGQFLCQQNKWEKAEKHFLKAVSDPVYRIPEIPYTNAGLCALHNKKLDKAEEYLRKALQKNPKFPRALYHMATLNYEQSHYPQANNYLLRYLKIAKHTSQTLWLGIRIERALNNRSKEASYILLLRKNFPDSTEIQLLNRY